MRARAGGANTTPYFLAAHFAKRNMKFGGGGKKLESESEGGRKFLPPNPPPASLREALRAGLPFRPPERSVSAARSAAISQDFVQKRFERRSVIATNSDILKIQRRFVARSPRRSLSRTAMRERVSLRRKPCISELNRKVGQIQIQFFGKANGGSELRSNSSRKCGISNFFLSAFGGIRSQFLISRFTAKGD